jgi:acyl dehydratase
MIDDVGTAIPAWTLPSVSAEKMKTMAALLHDPNPIHLDPAATAALGLGDRVVNQGPTNVGYIINLLASWLGGTEHIRRLRLRFLGNVFADDALEAGGVITARAVEGERVHLTCDVWLDRSDGVRLLAGTADVVTAPQT